MSNVYQKLSLYNSLKSSKKGGKPDGWTFEQTVKLIILKESHTHEECGEILGKSHYGCMNRIYRLNKEKSVVDEESLIKYLLSYYGKTQEDLIKVVEELEVELSQAS